MSAEELNEILEPKPVNGAKVIATAAWAKALSFAGHRRAANEIVERDLQVKRLLRVVEKADQSVGTTTTAGFASQLVRSSVADFFSTITGMSAGAKLIEAGTKIDLAGGAQYFPYSATTPTKCGWADEGDPIPVWSGSLERSTLGPSRKLSSITVVTRELLKRGAGGLATFETMLREKIAESIDAAIFSNDAGTTEVHPGLRHGIAPLSGSGESFPEDAMQKLVAALADIGGSGNVVVVAAPRAAATLRFLHPTVGIPIWPTRQLPVGVAIALDPLAFASSIGGIEFDVSENATVHMSDTPLEIVSGTGPATSAPIRSMWQTDALALRVSVDICFVQRASLITILENVSW